MVLSILRGPTGRCLLPFLGRHSLFNYGSKKINTFRVLLRKASISQNIHWLKYPILIGPLGLTVLGCHGNYIAHCRIKSSSRSSAALNRTVRDLSHDQTLEFDWWKLWELVSPDLLLLVLAAAVSEGTGWNGRGIRGEGWFDQSCMHVD